MEKSLVFIGLVSILHHSCMAQDSFSTTGGDAVGSGGSEAFAIGLVVYTEVSGSGGSASQGIEHAYEIFPVGIETDTNPSFSIYPNPTVNSLTIVSTSSELENLTYNLVDASGRIIISELIVQKDQTVDTYHLPNGIYLLNILKRGIIQNSFKIIKN